MNDLEGGINAPAAWGAEIPAANGVTNARSLARLYASLIGGVEDGPSEALISRVQIDKARTRQTEGLDAVLALPGLLEVETPFALGFWVNGGTSPFGGATGAFGHPGAGGSLGYGDPDRGIAGAYVMNRMTLGVAGDSRSAGLIEASYQAAGRSLD
jgi:CubicO group peptidase (beta-lactamase class C family)